MRFFTRGGLLVMAVMVSLGAWSRAARPSDGQAIAPIRLYVFDCGTLHMPDPARLNFKHDELANTDMSVACFLIVHPKGSLVWDVGAVPDSAWTQTGGPVPYDLRLTDGSTRALTLRASLREQLASIGMRPNEITYLALSHYHWDHTANANLFARSTWLVPSVERDAMFAASPPGTTLPATYNALRGSKTVLLPAMDYDVFGDNSVVIRPAPGHTPGHQMLIVKLATYGTVVLSGDLYHYPEELTLDRIPTIDVDPAATRAQRVALQAFLKQSGAHLWIQHDFAANARLRKAPAFYE